MTFFGTKQESSNGSKRYDPISWVGISLQSGRVWHRGAFTDHQPNIERIPRLLLQTGFTQCEQCEGSVPQAEHRCGHALNGVSGQRGVQWTQTQTRHHRGQGSQLQGY